MEKSSESQKEERKTIKGYTLDKLVGKGAFGEVYLGYNTQAEDRTLVAIKKINRAMFFKNGGSKELVQNEI